MNVSRLMLGTAMAAMALAIPASASAQACRGNLAREGQWSVGAQAAFPEGAKQYGGALNYNMSGPLTVGAGYMMTDFDAVNDPDLGELDADNAHTVSANVGYELPFLSVSSCIVSGVSYLRWSMEEDGAEATLSQLVVPIGLGFGRTMPMGPGLTVTPYAIPQYMYMRDSFELTGLGSASESHSEFGAEAGLVVGAGRFYFSGSVMQTTIEDTDPVFSLGAGLVF